MSRARLFGGSILVLAAWLTAGTVSAAGGRQGWRDAALASFDVVWQTIHDTYYDPDFGGRDWEAVRDELRPAAVAAASADEARDVIRQMLARLGQSHFVLLGPSAKEPAVGSGRVPFDIRVIDRDVVVTRVAISTKDGPRPGDRLLAIGRSHVDAMADAAWGETDDRAARLALWRAATAALGGRPDSTVTLVLGTPDGGERTARVVRRAEPGELVKLGNLPPLHARMTSESRLTPAGREVGVVAFNVWLPAIAEPFAKAIDTYRAADGLVIDLRGNPGGLADMLRGLAGHLLDRPALIGRMRLRDVTLELRANPRRSTSDGRRVTPYGGPVALLVDELTGSTSECFAAGLQSLGRVRVFGDRTMGQALPASTLQLPNGDVLMYVIGSFETSTGVEVEGAGVSPDEDVPLSIDQLAAGRDAPLEAALAWIDRVTSAR